MECAVCRFSAVPILQCGLFGQKWSFRLIIHCTTIFSDESFSALMRSKKRIISFWTRDVFAYIHATIPNFMGTVSVDFAWNGELEERYGTSQKKFCQRKKYY
jgi:hypothetical protein